MDGLVVHTRYLQSKPPLQFQQREMSGLFSTIVAFCSDVRKRRTWQEVYRSHHRSDESFNVPAEVRFTSWTVLYPHPIFLSSSAQSLGIELWGIVKMQHIRDASHRPGYFKLAIREPVFLWQDRMGQHHGDGGKRRSVEGNIESQHCTTGNIQCQSQPGPPDRLAIVLIDHNDIRRRVVDLDNIQR